MLDVTGKWRVRVGTEDHVTLFQSEHRTPRAAMVRLSRIIGTDEVHGGRRFYIITPDGWTRSLFDCYRDTYGEEPRRISGGRTSCWRLWTKQGNSRTDAAVARHVSRHG